MKKRILLLFSVLTVLAACGIKETVEKGTTETSIVQKTEKESTKDTSSEGKIVIEDQMGKVIEFDRVPKRVVTTIIPFPYIFYAIMGNTDSLIGVNPSSIKAYEDSVLKVMYPELANAETSFTGTDFVVNVEEVLKLQPDVVFQWKHKEEEIKKMEAAGIKVVAFQYGSLEDLETWINIIGKMFNKEERAEELLAYFHESVEEVTDKTETLTEDQIRKVLLMSDNLKVAGKGFQNYWIESAGGINYAKDLSGEQLYVNMEQIYEWNPEIIFIGNFTDMQPSDLVKGKLEGQDWSVVDAVKNKQVYKIPIGGYRWDPPGVETH